MQLNLLQTKALMYNAGVRCFKKHKKQIEADELFGYSRPSISVAGDKVLYADQSFLKCIALINGS